MHVISKKVFYSAARKYPNNAATIERIYKVLRKGEFRRLEDLKRLFPSLDNFKYKDKWWVIYIGDNNLRLIAFIEFKDNRMYVKYIVSHAEYDKLSRRYAKEAG